MRDHLAELERLGSRGDREGRTKAEPDQVNEWLTGFDESALGCHLTADTTFEDFFAAARLNPQASTITGVVCGIRVEDIDDPLMQKIRYLDKPSTSSPRARPWTRSWGRSWHERVGLAGVRGLAALVGQ